MKNCHASRLSLRQFLLIRKSKEKGHPFGCPFLSSFSLINQNPIYNPCYQSNCKQHTAGWFISWMSNYLSDPLPCVMPELNIQSIQQQKKYRCNLCDDSAAFFHGNRPSLLIVEKTAKQLSSLVGKSNADEPIGSVWF